MKNKADPWCKGKAAAKAVDKLIGTGQPSAPAKKKRAENSTKAAASREAAEKSKTSQANAPREGSLGEVSRRSTELHSHSSRAAHVEQRKHG